MNTTFIAMFIFTSVSFVNVIAKYFIARDNNVVQLRMLMIAFISFVFVSQFFLNYMATSQLCGKGQPKIALLNTFIPWLFIFGSIVFLLEMFPGWKSPFSNTFGYLVVVLMGINGIFLEMMPKGSSNKMIEAIYNDKSILINEFTPSNFQDLYEKNLREGIFTSDAKKYKTQFLNMVRLKDYVAEFVWYVLAGGLIIAISYNSMSGAKCFKDAETMKKEHRKWEAEKNREEQKEEPEKYIIRD